MNGSITPIDVVNTIIAGFALALSILSLAMQYKRSRFNLKVFPDRQGSFYFDALCTAYGNRESLIVSARIANNSNQPIHISDIQLILNGSMHVSAAQNSQIPYPTELPAETYATLKGEDGNVYFKFHNSDGYKIIDIKDSLITYPLYLNAYDSITGYILFPIAGESRNQTTLRFVTSRKNLDISCNFMTKKEYETSLD